MITKDTIDEIYRVAIIEDVINDFVPLKKRGANLLGLCPFHNEKTPSFTVSPAKGIYKCFGCGKSGNVVNFIMEHEQFTYPEALKYLAAKYQIPIEEEEQTPEQVQAANERESLYIVNKFANEYFIQQLNETDEGQSVGKSYFLSRGFSPETIKKFQLGYSPEKKDALTQAALEKGYQLAYLEKTGLTVVNGSQKIDRFRGRVMFPIHSLSGRVLGFGGRILKSNVKAAKYLNSPESEIYHKSKILYGLYFAKQAIVKNDECYLVEGYTDVISLHQKGIENVVASSGTSLTTEQIRLIQRYTPNITILYDGDAAGIKASFRGIDMILQEGMNVRVVLFPEGEDPDSYAQKHEEEELRNYLHAEAKDFITFKTSVLLEDVGDDPIKKAGLIKNIVESIALIPDQIKRSVYVQECSRLMDISEQALYAEMNKMLAKKKGKSVKIEPVDLPSTPVLTETKEEQNTNEKNDLLEKNIIRLLLNYTQDEIKIKAKNEENETIDLKVNVPAYIISEIEADELYFEIPLYQEVYNIFKTHINNDELPDIKTFTFNENQSIMELVVELTAEKYELHNWEGKQINVKTEKEKLSKAVLNALYAFKLNKVETLIKETEEAIKTATVEQLPELLINKKNYDDIKIKLAKSLGRTILK
ncbi:MAG: DNA primase [Vicingaceae bacterium]